MLWLSFERIVDIELQFDGDFLVNECIYMNGKGNMEVSMVLLVSVDLDVGLV